MNEAKPKEEIRERIIEIRGKKVMLVNDIAKILKYANGAKDLNKIIKRNIKKFPEDSYFILNKEETENMLSRCQNGTLNKSKNGRGNNLKYLPYVLSVEGLTVLSRVLKTDKSRVIYEEILPFFSSEDRCKIISKTSEIQERNIQNLIFEVRGKQVILDSDLASLYECTNGTKDINKAVKRNLNRFPEDFYFQLTKEELLNLKFQFGTSSWNEYGGLRKLPHVFTEQGVAMISSLLNSDKAAQISITIMRAFVIMRHYLIDNKDIYQSLNNLNNKIEVHEQKILAHDQKLDEIFSKFNKPKDKDFIYFNGEIYDAYSKVIDIMKESKNELVIIDNYADKTILDMISKVKIKVTLIVKTHNLLSKLDIEKYNKQYDNLKIIYDNTFHDRYIIIDKKSIYHLGSSINHIGSKICSINIISDQVIIDLLVNYVKKLNI